VYGNKYIFQALPTILSLWLDFKIPDGSTSTRCVDPPTTPPPAPPCGALGLFSTSGNY
jgi:hypothetical protein